MAKTHYTTQNLDNMGVAQVLMLKGACGAKTTFTAELLATDRMEDVDCARCITSGAKAIEKAAKAQARMIKDAAQIKAHADKLRAQRA